MIKFDFNETAKVTTGKHLGLDTSFNQVSTDSRNIETGALFVALKGFQFDGHHYVKEAIKAGACGLLVDHQINIDCPQIVVTDTEKALGQLAQAWRQKSEATIIALTGSNGKTTVKEMIRAILGFNHQVHATQGNMNNEIGLPLTLLHLQLAEYAVLEMGAAKKGDIHYLTHIAKPHIALLNNAGIAHIEGFGDKETLAKAKAEIIEGLDDNGIFIYDADSEWRTLWKDLGAGKKQITFGFSETADIRSADPAETIWNNEGFKQQFSIMTPDQLIPIELPLAGLHNQKNALAACAVAWQLNIPVEQIQQGLAGMRPVAGRLNPTITSTGTRVIDDSYNANPSSTKAAIEFLASLAGETILVLGEMAELGKETLQYHQDIVAFAKVKGIYKLYSYGEALFDATPLFTENGFHFDYKIDLINQLTNDLKGNETVLIKGSRQSGMEIVTQILTGEKQL